MCLKNKLNSHEFPMRKRRSWFSFVKRLIVSEPKSKNEKKSRKWRWVFGGFKANKYYPTTAEPERLMIEAREEQRKQAVAVAIAMAAAAEAAVAAARAAAEVVQLTRLPQSYILEYEERARNLAATKIQAAYRAHLARKALKALKGLVRLQAMVRGQIVRRRVITQMKCFQIAETQSQVQQVRVPTFQKSCNDGEKKQFLSPKDELEERKTKVSEIFGQFMKEKCFQNDLRSKSQRNWDYSLFSKEDMETLWLQKQEAAVRRERMKKYSFSHRERRNDQNVETLIPTKENGRWSKKLDNIVASHMMKRRNGHKQDSFTIPRRSFSHAKHKSIGDETLSPNSPVFPTYMAATESAKAKARSASTQGHRVGIFYYNSPYDLRLASWSPFNGEFACKNGLY